jgi:hypothetical protein
MKTYSISRAITMIGSALIVEEGIANPESYGDWSIL